MDLKQILRQVPDFPKPGINFIDITTLLHDPNAFDFAIEQIAKDYEGQKIDRVIGIESRGFIFGAPLALKFGASFVPVRKPNKLPAATYSYSYELEYGKDTIQIHQDAIKDGDRVVIIDDLLATGGTAEATIQLLKNFNCTIAGFSFVIELTFLNGRNKLQPHPVHTLVTYDSE